MNKTIKKALLISISALLINITTSAFASPKKVTAKSSTDSRMLQLAYKQLIVAPQRKTQKKKLTASKKRSVSSRYHATQVAKLQLRKKYRWGGATPRTGFDCSGLTYYAFKVARIDLPRTAAAQYKHTKRVSLSKLQTGDLIFFHTRRTRTRVNHVGLYLGNGEFIHAPRRGKRVSITKLNKYWRRKAVGAGRV